MKIVKRKKQAKKNKYDDILDALSDIAIDEAIEVQELDYTTASSIRTMVWFRYGSSAYTTKYDKNEKLLTIWKK